MMLFSPVLLLIFFIFCVANVFSYDIANDIDIDDKSAVWHSGDNELIFAHVIYRHGQRNTLQKYAELCPSDPYGDESHWPGGFDQLTSEGKRQQFKLGQYFRRRYHKLLGDKYSPKAVYIHASDKDRTIMSAQANLAGLFPPSAEEKWHGDIDWQPIPVHTIPVKLDYAIRPGYCPKYYTALEKYENESPEVQRIFQENNENIVFWSKMCGKNLTTISDLYFFYDNLLVQSLHNKTLADWAQEAIQPNGVLEQITGFYLKMLSITRELARLQSGYLIKEMFEHFAQKLNSTLTPNRSLWMYSAHDSTISALLNSFGVFELHIPPLGSSIHLELYKVNEKEHYIQIFYRKSDEEILLPLNIPNCGEKCSLDQLYKLYNDIIPDRDHDTECRLPQ